MKGWILILVVVGMGVAQSAWGQFGDDGTYNEPASGQFGEEVMPAPTPLTETICTDNIDNDGDGTVDCQDLDCSFNSQFCPGFFGLEDCFDGYDNDQDGLVDCQDADCRADCPVIFPHPEDPGTQGSQVCEDGIDNDGNGLTDCFEPNCFSFCQLSSSPPPVLGAGVQRVATGTAGVLAVAAVVSSLASVATAAASAQSGPELLRALLPFSAVHRRQAPWGRVVEVRSNKPIADAVLSLIDEGGKVRATETTRRDGTFGFFVPPGTYRLVAQQAGYQFPAPAPDVALFPGEQVYDGGWIPVTEESVLALVIVGQELSHTALASAQEHLQGIWARLQVWQARLAIPLLLVGGALTLLSFWNRPSGLLGFLLGVYLILFALELLLSRVARRTVGAVRDGLTRQGVDLAVVRLLDRAGRLAATRVTLPSGHFFLMPPPGKYRVEIVHRSYQPYVKDPFSVRKFFFGVAGIRAKLLPK